VRRASRGTALVGVGLSAVLALSACGNAAPPAAGGGGEPAPASPSPVYTDPGHLWPDAAHTVVVTPQGQRPPLPPLGEYEEGDLRTYAEQNGRTFEQARQEQADVAAFHEWVAATVKPLLGDRFSEARPEMEGEPAWVGLTGDVPPELVAAAEAFHLPMELRGGALLTEAEADRVRDVGTDTFAASAPKGFGWSSHLDIPTATFVIAGYPPEEWEPDDALLARVVDQASRVLGREAPFRVDLQPDERDPTSTEPAVWYLPAGFVADPGATRIEVVVDARGCASGVGPADRMAPPQVEVTDTQVRIAVSTYILKGPQTCLGHPTAPLVVDLGEPLGDRELIDVNGTTDDSSAPPGGDVIVPSAG